MKAKPIKINGTVYPSIKVASRKLAVSEKQLSLNYSKLNKSKLSEMVATMKVERVLRLEKIK